MNITGQIFEQKKFRVAALVLFVPLGGGLVLMVLNWAVGFSYGDNSPISVVGHVVGTMIWGAVCATAIRIAKV